MSGAVQRVLSSLPAALALNAVRALGSILDTIMNWAYESVIKIMDMQEVLVDE